MVDGGGEGGGGRDIGRGCYITLLGITHFHFANNLYTLPIKLIGLKSLILMTLLFLIIKAIKETLRDF